MRFLVFIFLLIPGSVLHAETSVFQKLATLRFGSEQVVFMQDGELDLTKLGAQEFFHAQGEVWFFPGEFIEPTFMDAAAFKSLVAEKKAIKAPLRLRSYPNPLAGTEKTFGTYIIRVHNVEQKRIAVYFPRLFHPFTLWFVDAKGQERLQVHQQLNPDPAANRNQNNNTAPAGGFDIHGDFYLFGQASSPLLSGKNSLNISSFYIGDDNYLSNQLYKTRFFGALISGSFLIVGVFYLFIYFFRRQDTSSLYLAGYAFCSFVLTLFHLISFEITPQQILDRFTMVNLFGVCALQYYLMNKISFTMKKRTSTILRSLLLTIPAFGSIIILIRIIPLMSLFFLLSFASSLTLIFATLYIGVKHRLSGMRYFLAGTLMNCAFQFPILITGILGMNTEAGYNIVLANYFMAIALALVNAKEFAVTYRKSLEQGLALEETNNKITFLNTNLEKLVDYKTREIRSLLDHIPQGVLSVGEEGLIAQDYSAHLKVILECDAIGLLPFEELILNHCEMSSDQRDQIWQTINAAVGSHLLSFEVNADKLPGELRYHRMGRTKFLKATWNIQVEQEIVIQLLVTLLDVTAEKSLEQEAEKQRQELSLIQELIHVAPGKAAQFFATSRTLLEDNVRILDQPKESLDAAAIRMLFVNAHTVKGAARTLHFKALARRIHDMEETYTNILKKGELIDQVQLQDDIRETFRVFHHYVTTNRETLNRTGKDDRVSIGRDDMERLYLRLKAFLESPTKDWDAITQWMQEMRKTLTLLIFENLPKTFERYRDKILKIAQDTGRAPPLCDFQIDDVSLSSDQLAVLDNCMIHLLTNALDHGIEKPDERLQQHKAESGTISIATRTTADRLTIRMSDDGRGLPIRKLKEKGEKQGILGPESTMQDIAQTIFASGVSTAREVTDISGRGVGMNAVQMFLEKSGGSIEVKLGEPKDPRGDYYAFWFEIHFPLSVQAAA